MENSLNTRNDELVLLYIEHAIKNLNDASVNLEKSFVNDKIKYPELITDAIIDGEWNYYLISSIILNAQEIITVKIWFNEIVKINVRQRILYREILNKKHLLIKFIA